MKQIIDKTFRINYNPPLKQKMLEAKGGRFPTQIEILVDRWLPKLESKFQRLYDLVKVEEYKEVMDQVKKAFLRDDIREYIEALKFQMQDNPDTMVVCHNDIQENNILSMRRQSCELAIIDYEYSSFGNKEFDIANIF